MPFKKIDIQNEIKKKCTESQTFQEAWNNSREEYKIIGEMIQLRKQNNITQSQLSSIIGSKQQIISRIEKKDHSPSLGMVCKILDALGYELQIVKKRAN